MVKKPTDFTKFIAIKEKSLSKKFGANSRSTWKIKSKKRAILYATHNRDLSNKADYKLNILDGNISKKNAWSY